MFHDGMRLALIGLAVGLVVAVPLTALVRSEVQGIAPVQPIPVLIGALLLLIATAGASLVPASRATRIDPATTLRQD